MELATYTALLENYCSSYRLEHAVHGDGNHLSKIAVVGEYPGANESALKKPFVGASGKLLWDQLRNYKLYKTDVWATNLCKRPVSDRRPLTRDEEILWQDCLQKELELLPNLEIIFAMGAHAIKALLGFDDVNNRRGSVYSIELNGRTVQVVCSMNPAAAIRNPEVEIIFAMDVAKLNKVISKDFCCPEITAYINPEFWEAMYFMQTIQRKGGWVSIDIENGARTYCIGLAISGSEGMCINFRSEYENRFSLEEEMQLWYQFQQMVDSPNVKTILQNGNYDAHYMGIFDWCTFNVDFDTMVAHHTLYPRLPHSLAFLVSQYTDHPYYKDELAQHKEGEPIDTLWTYNVKDACLTFMCAMEIMEELRTQDNLDKFYFSHVNRVTPHLVQSTITGIKVDLEVKNNLAFELQTDLSAKFDKALARIRGALNDPNYEVNLNSPKQMAHLFYDLLGLTGTSRTTNRAQRDQWLEDVRTPPQARIILAELNKYAEEHKFYSTYVTTKLDDDNRFRAVFKQTGVSRAPGRLSSSQTLWGTGGNAQNQPRKAFQMYVADEGLVWIYFDLAQAEARYVAWDAWIEQWIEDFERARIEGGFDAHRALAAVMFKVPYDEVPTDDEDADGNFTIRYIAKRCRHGLNYRMRPARLAITTGMSYIEAVSNFNIYHTVNPELQVWWKDVIKEMRRKRKLFNCFGRRFINLGRLDSEDIMDSVVAFKPQSAIGDKTQRVWYQCHEDDRWDLRKARIMLNVHDALWALATPDYAMTALSIMKKYAEEPLLVPRTRDGKVHPMIIPADCKISVADEHGIHRMSGMQKVQVETAT